MKAPIRTPRTLRLVVWLGWTLFGLGLLSGSFLYLRHGGSSIPKVRWGRGWGRPHWVLFRDPEGLFVIGHPSNWDESAPFERFTRHRIAPDLVAMDTLALRFANPTAVVVVIRYVSRTPLSPEDWLKLTHNGGPLADAFGEQILSRARTRLAGQPTLAVIAQGMVADQRFRLESWLIPAGTNAYRLTIGSPLNEFARAAPTLHRIVASFRFTPAAPGTTLNHEDTNNTKGNGTWIG